MDDRLEGVRVEEVVAFHKMQVGQFPIQTKESYSSLTLNILLNLTQCNVLIFPTLCVIINI